MSRYLIIVFLALLLNVSQAKEVSAAWWKPAELATPEQTTLVKEEKRSFAGKDMTFYYYTSDLSAEMIKDFYKRQLVTNGWQSKNLFQDIANIPNAEKIGSYLRDSMDNNLIFEKEKDTIILSFVPGKFSSDNKTRYTLTKGTLEVEPGALSGTDLIPQLKDKPKIDVYPVYPGASLVTFSEKPGLLNATYITKDDLNYVAQFYKDGMGRYGWRLQEEQAPKEMNIAMPDVSQHCPSCKAEPTVKPAIWTSQLYFTNQKGDQCALVLSNIEEPKAGGYPIRMTTIMVGYNEKKR